MKRILLIVFLFIACAENQRPNPDIIAWQGYATEDKELAAIYQETLDCVGDEADNLSIPYVYLSVEPMTYDGRAVEGYFIFNEYVAVCMNCGDHFVFTTILRHEFIHFILNRGDEIHTCETMIRCGGIDPSAN